MLSKEEEKKIKVEYYGSSMKKKLRHIIGHYGLEKQAFQAVEEMSELTVEIVKNVNRDTENLKALRGEIADVCVMIEQLKIIFGVKEESLKEEMLRKVDRQIDRIYKEETSHCDCGIPGCLCDFDSAGFGG